MKTHAIKKGQLVQFESIFFGEFVNLGVFVVLEDCEFSVKDGEFSLMGDRVSPRTLIDDLVEKGIIQSLEADTITLSDD